MVVPPKTRANRENASVTTLAYLVLGFANLKLVSAARIRLMQRQKDEEEHVGEEQYDKFVTTEIHFLNIY